MPRLEHFFLGPFEVRLDGKPVTGFESDKVRALLAYLAVEADHAHSRDALAALIWPDQADETARQNLRHVLYKLRQALHDTAERADAPAFLVITPQTAQMNPDADIWLDLAVFSSLVAACRSHRGMPSVDSAKRPIVPAAASTLRSSAVRSIPSRRSHAWW